MESNFKNNNGGYNKFNNNFQPQAAAAQPVAEVEAPKAGFVKTGTKWVANKINNLPKPAKTGLVVVGAVGIAWAVYKFTPKRIKKPILGVLGFGKKDSDNEEKTTTEGVEFEETK